MAFSPLCGFLGVYGLLMGLVPGCAAPHVPLVLAVPPVSVSVDHYLGSPLTGPIDKPLAVTNPQDAYAITATFIERSSMIFGVMAVTSWDA